MFIIGQEETGREKSSSSGSPGAPLNDTHPTIGVAPAIGTTFNGIVTIVAALGAILANGTAVGFVDTNDGQRLELQLHE